ncbi:MAG: hypothetical protein Q9227_009105 [Pyrenula ochraceoflavens]
MSLFGTSPTGESTPSLNANSKSLFGDDVTPAPTTSSSLFADDTEASPWSMPTPKKSARRELVKNLLPGTDVPENYVDAFDIVLDTDRVGSGISLTGVKNILGSSELSAADQATILNTVIPGGQETANGLGRGEFNVLLALIGLGQEGDEITLDGVDDRRRKLPVPNIQYFDKLRSAKSSTVDDLQPQQPPSTPPSKSSPAKSPSKPKPAVQDSLGDIDSDPWASPAANKPASTPNTSVKRPSAIPDHVSNPAISSFSQRTTSAYTTHSDSPNDSNGPGDSGISSGGDGWNSYNGASGGGFTDAGLGEGFGASSGDQGQSNGNNPRQSMGSSTLVSRGQEENIIVTMLPEKEGMFMFQHRNYEVKSVRRGATVVRRYSDFVWLLDCLHKRYPFRQLPLLPPKRVAVNGTHLAADTNSFIEKRRRGLARFANTLVRHPILNQEQLVTMFLTVPTELSVWRKQATISVQEEFTGKPLPPDLEDSLPATLPDTFATVRSGVNRSAAIYINLCTLLERLVKRNEGLAADNLRFSLALQSLTAASPDTYAMDTNDVPLLNEGLSATAKHLSTAQTLLEDECQAWDAGVLEDLKRQRDVLVSMRELFERRDRLARDNIPQLERRIDANESKLAALRQKPDSQVKPGEIEKVEGQIVSDKESIVAQHARGVFIIECVRDEIRIFMKGVGGVSRLWQDWAAERVKFAELGAGAARGWVEGVESMPVGD